MMKTLLNLLFICFLIQLQAKAQTKVTDLVFNIDVSIGSSPSFIQLKWNKLPGVNLYNILRKQRSEKTFTMIAADVQASDTVYTDYSVPIGSAYEYCVQSASNNNVSGYVYAGIELPVNHTSGEVLLLIDQTYQYSAEAELNMYAKDLIKEGWKVSKEFVSRTQSVASVKQLILDKYNQNPNELKGVILLGHLPVPYSGKIAPDAHTDHLGAWPSDVYYADVQSNQTANWNDLSLNTVSATDSRNHNIIGDGKFDASNKPTTSNFKLFVGRIDVYNMPTISTDDAALFKQYLMKNHSYRACLKKYRQAALVDDNFGYYSGEAFAQNGWRNFSSLVGNTNTSNGDYFTNLKTNSYIWSYACGGGWYTGASGVGTTNDFQSNKIESIFTMLYGSYFGDWDNQNNFLRAPIASPSATLVSCWGGRPNWYFHNMAMGEPIGYSYLSSIDNSETYFPKGYYSNKVHQSLQGDPTLKMYMFEAPAQISMNSVDNNTKMKLEWAHSTASNVLGYYVYKANSIDEDFVLITPNYITGNSFIDEEADMSGSSSFLYMVKAVRLETSTCGTFYNLSPGILSLEAPQAIALPVTFVSFTGRLNDDHSNSLFWKVIDEQQIAGYEVEVSENQVDFKKIGYVEASSHSFGVIEYSFNDETPSQSSYYRLKIIDLDGKETYSSMVHLQRLPSLASISLYPSPFTDQINIQFQAELKSNLLISMYDLSGKQLLSEYREVEEGNNLIQLSNLNNLLKGMYLIHIEDMDTRSKYYFKILKQE